MNINVLREELGAIKLVEYFTSSGLIDSNNALHFNIIEFALLAIIARLQTLVLIIITQNTIIKLIIHH